MSTLVEGRESKVESLKTIERAVAAVCSLPAVDCPVKHHFTTGFYLREIFMPRGTVVISKKHVTEHQFVISKGRVSVWDPFGGTQHLAAPYVGLTKPGTQRVLYIHEDCVWTTAHANPDGGQDVDAIEARIIEAQVLKLPVSIEPEILKELKEWDAAEPERPARNVPTKEVL